jgi:hypothetical protein
MCQRADRFVKNALRETLGIASVAETEVEALATTQKLT